MREPDWRLPRQPSPEVFSRFDATRWYRSESCHIVAVVVRPCLSHRCGHASQREGLSCRLSTTLIAPERGWNFIEQPGPASRYRRLPASRLNVLLVFRPERQRTGSFRQLLELSMTTPSDRARTPAWRMTIHKRLGVDQWYPAMDQARLIVPLLPSSPRWCIVRYLATASGHMGLDDPTARMSVSVPTTLARAERACRRWLPGVKSFHPADVGRPARRARPGRHAPSSLTGGLVPHAPCLSRRGDRLTAPACRSASSTCGSVVLVTGDNVAGVDGSRRGDSRLRTPALLPTTVGLLRAVAPAADDTMRHAAASLMAYDELRSSATPTCER